MFKFNFNNEEDTAQSELVAKENEIKWYECKEIKIPENITEVVRNIPRDQIIKTEYGCNITLSCLSAKEVMNVLKEKPDNEEFFDVLKADKEHSDLLPGKYEGGLKTWECTKDLVVYFTKNILGELNNKLEGKNVLDLGCGSGILGIMCLLHGAEVTFQDYNQEVLEAMTIPNIFSNCGASVRNKVKLYSGDWLSFLDLVLQNTESNQNSKSSKFDYILTSETIYNPQNYQKLIQIFKILLKSDGITFVAAKTHYFGVGGNLIEFENELHKCGLFSNLCWKTTDGVSRGILKVQHFNGSIGNERKN